MNPEGRELGSSQTINSHPFAIRAKLLAAGTAIALVALAAGSAGCRTRPELTPQEAEGKRLYSGRCAHCHEDNDLGLKKVPPDLHRAFAEAKLPSGALATDPNVRGVVLAGKGLMPSFAGRFTEEQMSSLLAYLHTGLR